MVREVNLKFLKKDYLTKKVVATVEIICVYDSHNSVESTIELKLDESLLFEEDSIVINSTIVDKLKSLSLI